MVTALIVAVVVLFVVISFLQDRKRLRFIAAYHQSHFLNRRALKPSEFKPAMVGLSRRQRHHYFRAIRLMNDEMSWPMNALRPTDRLQDLDPPEAKECFAEPPASIMLGYVHVCLIDRGHKSIFYTVDDVARAAAIYPSSRLRKRRA